MAKEVLYEWRRAYTPSAVMDLTPTPELPLACIMTGGIHNLRICCSEEHAVQKRYFLAHRVFRAKQDQVH
eukprot:8625965-Prorocentrum_lima.AAC.1